MNACNNLPISLKPWHKVVSIKNKPITLKIGKSYFEYSLNNYAVKSKGYYAKYDEGIFVCFLNSDSLYIGWKKTLVSLAEIDAVEWGVNWHSRYFKAFYQGKIVLDFNYHTCRRFFINPLRLLEDIFIPDDDWSLVADLPSFLYHIIEDGNPKERFEALMED